MSHERIFTPDQIESARVTAYEAVEQFYRGENIKDPHDWQMAQHVAGHLAHILTKRNILEEGAILAEARKCREELRQEYAQGLNDPEYLEKQREKLEKRSNRGNGEPVSFAGDPALKNILCETRYREYDQGLSKFLEALGVDLKKSATERLADRAASAPGTTPQIR